MIPSYVSEEMPDVNRRRKRIEKKRKKAKILPIHVTTINFINEGNIGNVVRAAACFGAAQVHVIGSLPEYKVLKAISGTTSPYVDIITYGSEEEFLEKNQEHYLVAAELSNDSISLYDYEFPFNDNRIINIITGHETNGVPGVIMMHSDKVYIPMPGLGVCLNTAQAANIMLYEASKQLAKKDEEL